MERSNCDKTQERELNDIEMCHRTVTYLLATLTRSAGYMLRESMQINDQWVRQIVVR